MAAGGGAVVVPLAEDGRLKFAIRFSPHIVCKGLEVPGGVDQFQHPGDDEAQVDRGIGGRREDGELLDEEKGHVYTADLLSRYVVKYQTADICN